MDENEGGGIKGRLELFRKLIRFGGAGLPQGPLFNCFTAALFKKKAVHVLFQKCFFALEL